MKKTTYILTIIFLTNSLLYSQNTDCKYHQKICKVISKNGLNVRTEPDINSKTIMSIPYWENVKVCQEKYSTDTINDIVGNWLKIADEDISGFVFNGFLIDADTILLKNKDIRILVENIFCAPPNFDPKLNWYGLYEHGKIDTLIKVDVTIRRITINEEGKLENNDIIIETNNNKQAILLIGTKDTLTEKIAFWNNKVVHKSDFLYPGEIFRIQGYHRTFELNAIGTVKDNIDCYKKFADYRLLLSERIGKSYPTQDLMKDITYRGECTSLELKWCGKIDNDNIPDLILTTGSTQMITIYLFLSSKAKKNDFIKKVDEWTIGSCY